ncbi:helix-turn-helix domain-containing protein [Chungangia koreensis]|uniref:Helix-turn-helix domain-containing protein n=1 Tax=Chungangia koreensis TaxID=752657 RepID=A0ABV8X0J2_9LACT
MDGFGEYLKEERIKAGLTVSELANASSVSQPYLSQIETGKRKASIPIINKLAKALELDQFEMAEKAGYYTAEEIALRKELQAYEESKTPEERDLDNELQIQHFLIEEFRREEYPELDEVLKYKKKLYFKKYELSDEDKKTIYKILDAMFEGKEENYPPEEEIEKKFMEQQQFHENIRQVFDKDKLKKED